MAAQLLGARRRNNGSNVLRGGARRRGTAAPLRQAACKSVPQASASTRLCILAGSGIHDLRYSNRLQGSACERLSCSASTCWWAAGLWCLAGGMTRHLYNQRCGVMHAACMHHDVMQQPLTSYTPAARHAPVPVLSAQMLQGGREGGARRAGGRAGECVSSARVDAHACLHA